MGLNMVKKIKKSRSYSYNDRTIKPNVKGKGIPTPEDNEEILDFEGKDASYVKRILAYAIDLAIYIPIALVFQRMTIILRSAGGSENERNALYMTISMIIFAVLLFGYLPNKWKGQTIGKKLLKIRLVPTDRKRIDISKYLVREFLVKVTLCWIVTPIVAAYGLYKIYVAKENNPILIHDKLANTRVVEIQEVK